HRRSEGAVEQPDHDAVRAVLHRLRDRGGHTPNPRCRLLGDVGPDQKVHQGPVHRRGHHGNRSAHRGDHGQIPRVLTEGAHRRSEQCGEEVPRVARFRLRRLSTAKIARVHTGPDPIDNHTWLHRGPHVPSSARELRSRALPSGGRPVRDAVLSNEGVSFVITDGFLFISLLLAISAVLVIAGNSGRFKVFKYVPGFVFLYIVAALINTVGLFDLDAIDGVGDGVQDALLPAMILLLLFKCDVRQIVRLGPKLLLTYAVTAASIMIGFIVAYLIVHSALAPESWKALGALNASWTGGSANMVAVQDILEAPEDIFGYV